MKCDMKCDMKKVLVIGCPGAGKSCFARKLHAATDLPLYPLDLIWHKTDKTTVTREEFDRALEEILLRDEWIIDGNYNRTLEERFLACDTVFFLDLPIEDCLRGAQSRIGKKREDLPWIEETFDEEFKEWILRFPKDKLPHIYELLEKYPSKTVVIFRSHEEIDAYFSE